MESSARQPVIVCYVSGHGFGHAVRVMEVLREVRLRHASARFVIRTPLGREFFDRNLTEAVQHGFCRLDVGAVQSDSITVDPEASLRAYAEISAHSAELLASEEAALASLRPSVVLGDIPALAFELAARIGVPGIAMTNFSWDWIYADYARDLPRYRPLVEDLRDSYSKATLLLRLPFPGDLSAFPRVRDIPLVARRARVGRDEVRRRLALEGSAPVALLSFGGIGLDLIQPPQAPNGVRFLALGALSDKSVIPPGCRLLSQGELLARGLRHEDVVGACDAVITKPGYGIVAECIANGTPMIYTQRGRFAEYDCLVAGIERHLPNAFIDNDDLRAGRWSGALQQVLSQKRTDPTIDVSGGAVAAEVILSFVGEAAGRGLG